MTPFFLDTQHGKRFCLYHPPKGLARPKGAVLYVHPFGEEMNMARRVAAQQARAFSVNGYAVLQIDLHGCGDSDGELRSATWEIWLEDLDAAARWVAENGDENLSVWGLRLGATLAVDFARRTTTALRDCLLWQPVLQGSTYLTQFLRLHAAGAMLHSRQGGQKTVPALRLALEQGETVEVGGYELSSVLAADIEHVNLQGLKEIRCPIHWIDLVDNPHPEMSPARKAAALACAGTGADLRLCAVHAPALWAVYGTTECTTLVEETLRTKRNSAA